MAKRECVEHFTSGREAWKVGLLGFLSQLRGLITTILLTVATMGSAPWWWPPDGDQITVSTRSFVLVLIGIIGLAFIVLSRYLRFRARRSLDIKHYLHELAHFVRDSYAECSRSTTFPPSNDHFHFGKYSQELCNRVRTYFTRQCNDPHIGVAIRLAVPDKTGTGVEYRTVARSGLNANRRATTEAIHQSEGTPRYFLDRNSVGVLIYNDLPAAIKMGAFKETRTESRFPTDIVSMIVAPLNACWDQGDMRMIGLLCITSPDRNVFSAQHVDSALFAADTVSNSVASVVRTLKGQNESPF